MGLLSSIFSKAETKDTETIEKDVLQLLYKISENETGINVIVKEKILKTLEIYAKRINEKKKGKAETIQRQIDEAKKSVNNLRIKKKSNSKINLDRKDIVAIKNRLLFIAKNIQKNEISEKYCNKYLEEAIALTTVLENSYTSTTNQSEEEIISIGFLKLFLKCPQIQVATIIPKINNDLTEIVENLDTIQIQNENLFNDADIKNKLLEITKHVETITRKTTKKTNRQENNYLETSLSENRGHKLLHSKEKPVQQKQILKLKKPESGQRLNGNEDNLKQKKKPLENFENKSRLNIGEINRTKNYYAETNLSENRGLNLFYKNPVQQEQTPKFRTPKSQQTLNSNEDTLQTKPLENIYSPVSETVVQNFEKQSHLNKRKINRRNNNYVETSLSENQGLNFFHNKNNPVQQKHTPKFRTPKTQQMLNSIEDNLEQENKLLENIYSPVSDTDLTNFKKQSLLNIENENRWKNNYLETNLSENQNLNLFYNKENPEQQEQTPKFRTPESQQMLNSIEDNLEQEIKLLENPPVSNTVVKKFESENRDLNLLHKKENPVEQKQTPQFRTLEQRLNNFKHNLKQQKELLENIYPPVSDTVIKKFKKEIDYLRVQLDKMFAKKLDIAEQELKDQLQNKLKQLRDKLNTLIDATKEITQSLKLLEDIKNKCLNLLQSRVHYFEKKKQIDAYKKEITDITCDHPDIDLQKKNVLNSIEEVIIAETAWYMRHIYVSIKQHKLYSEQFPFPTSLSRYNSKMEEIKKLFNDLDQLPEDHFYINKRKQQLRENVDEVINILTEKAKHNETVIDALKKLEELNKRVNQDYEKRELNFYTYRRELQVIPNDLSKKCLQKKMEIIDFLHGIEAEFIPNHSEMQKIKTHLNKIEKKVYYPISNEAYHQMNNELQNLIDTCHARNYEFIKEIALLVSEVLENQQIVCSNVKYLDELEYNINNALDKRTLEDYENVLKNYEINMFNNDTLWKIKDQYYLKKCFFYLNDLHTRLEELIKNINKESFINNIDILFYIKETIEDMPQDNTHLNSHKEEVLNKTYTCLQSLDKSLAETVFKRKQPEPFLNLKDHFTFNVNSLNVSRNTEEFVTIILNEAKSYESSVLCFLGSTDCIDFYIIRENLTRLLKDLDTVEFGSNSDLLQQVVDAIEYIKNLIHMLNLNASEE